MFSPGAYINNRSLMPCQEPPIAMSTWQAAIHVPTGCTVLMSGNELSVQNPDGGDYGMQIISLPPIFYYYKEKLFDHVYYTEDKEEWMLTKCLYFFQ